MPVKKLSVALDERVAAEAAAAAERGGLSLSAWLNAAAEHALTVERGLVAVADYEAEHHAFTADELAWADAQLDGRAADKPASLQ